MNTCENATEVRSSEEKSRSTGRNERGTQTRAKIIDQARKQITAHGLKSTTATTITSALNIPRPLFYHYFSNLDELVEIMLEELLDDFNTRLSEWKAQSAHEDINQSLESIVELWRAVHNDNSLFAAELTRGGNASLYTQFMITASENLARFLTDEVVPTFEDRMSTPLNHVYHTLFALIVGLNQVMTTEPDFSNEDFKQIIAQTLRLENYVNTN